MMKTKCVVSVLAAFLCAAMTITPVTAEAAVAEKEEAPFYQLCSDGYNMTSFFQKTITEVNGKLYHLNSDILTCKAELSEDGVFSIKYVVTGDGFTVPFNESISTKTPSLIVLGSVAANTDCKMEVITPSETTEVTGNFYKDMLWHGWDSHARETFASMALFDKMHPIAITPNDKEAEYLNEDGTLKTGAVLAEIKIYDYQYGTPVFVDDLAFSADTAANYKKYYGNDDLASHLCGDAADDDVLIDTQASPGCMKNAFSWYDEAIANSEKNGDGTGVYVLVDGKGNRNVIFDEKTFYQTLEESNNDENAEAYGVQAYVSTVAAMFVNDMCPILDPDWTYNALTVSAEPLKRDAYVGMYPTSAGTMEPRKYRAGYEVVPVGDFYYDMCFSSYATAEIDVCAGSDIDFTEDTSLELGNILVVSGDKNEKKSMLSEGKPFNIKAGTSYKKGDVIGTIVLSPSDEFGFNPYETGTEVVYYLGGKRIESYMTADGRVSAIQKTLGDADDSEAVDILDVIQTNKFLLGCGKVKDTKAADIDGDGQVTPSDALNILKIALDMLSPDEINLFYTK